MAGNSDRTVHGNRSEQITQRVDEHPAPQKVGLKQSIHPLLRTTHEEEHPTCPIDQQPGAEEQSDRYHGNFNLSKSGVLPLNSRRAAGSRLIWPPASRTQLAHLDVEERVWPPTDRAWLTHPVEQATFRPP